MASGDKTSDLLPERREVTLWPASVNCGRPEPSLQVSGTARPVPWGLWVSRGACGFHVLFTMELWVESPALVSETPHFLSRARAPQQERLGLGLSLALEKTLRDTVWW